MSKYYYLKGYIDSEIEAEIDHMAAKDFGSTGVEDFSIDEEKVDSILGDRSYSGGDVPETVIYEVEDTLYTEGNLKKYYFNTEDEALSFLNLLNKKNQTFHLVAEDAVDWNEEWKKTYAPILVSEELEIIPSWNVEDYKSQAHKQIYIYPGMGFGTGSHETTFLCLKLYTEFKKNNIKSCLDFGCGSGILGLATLLFEPNLEVDLYDIDPEAIENTKQNIELNKLQEKNINLLLPSHRKSINKKYDLVFANILQNVLLLEKKYLVTCLNPGGQIILSGLLNGQEDEVVDRYLEENSTLKHIETIYKGDWLAIIMGQV